MASVARVTEISVISEKGFDDAVRVGIKRAHRTLRGLRSAWVKEQSVEIAPDGEITGFRVNLLVTFLLDESITRELLSPDPATQLVDFAAMEDEA